MNIMDIFSWTFGIFFFLAVLVFQILAGHFRREIWGYICPALFFVSTLVWLFLKFDYSLYATIPQIFIHWIKFMLLYNIPTFLMLAAFFISRYIKEKKERENN